ncbi:hypothetical protein VTO42DRAFT_7398 [Malbranchea cinnamomea]
MENQEPGHIFASADRIRQLNEIDSDVAKLVQSAGLAIQALTEAPPPSSSPDEGALEAHKRAFKQASAQYFALLSSIDVRLRRQVYALEEAGIIQPDSGEGTTGQTTGGVNQLDISWLNSRKDTVSKDKEAELWANARKFVLQQKDPTNSIGASQPAAGDNMEVD